MTDSRVIRGNRWRLWRARGAGLYRLGSRMVERFLATRVMGLAAEMTYYALLSLFPLTGAIGVSLGFLGRLFGAEEAQRAETAILGALQVVFSPDATAEVIEPLVEGLLRQERTGFALGGFLLSLFFASRIFRSAIEALDTVYGVKSPRGTLALWARGILLAVGAVFVVATILALVVVEPLVGGIGAVAERLGLSSAFQAAWTIVRWPAVFAVATAFLALLYHGGPNTGSSWRESLPGAVFGMGALVLVSVGFRFYIEVTGLGSPEIENADDAVALALQVIGALLAALFWMWLSSMAVLAGGVVNAELRRARRGME